MHAEGSRAGERLRYRLSVLLHNLNPSIPKWASCKPALHVSSRHHLR
jgi:hypothetical protein